MPKEGGIGRAPELEEYSDQGLNELGSDENSEKNGGSEDKE